MAKLDKEQRKVAKKIIRVGKRRGETPRAIVAALATGLQESGLRNLKGGDRDSQGWRQERAQYYSNPRNVKAAANRFYNEYDSDAPKKGPITAAAQAVQQSAYPSAYADDVDDARAILRGFNRRSKVGPGKAVAGPQRGSKRVTTKGTITKPGTQQALQLAALDFIKNRKEPGAVLEYVQEKKEIQANSKIPVSVSSNVRGPKSASQIKSQRKDQGRNTPSKHLSGGAIEIGTAVAKKFGLTVTSTTGGSHTPGSYHYQKRAIDISGSPAQMRKAYRYIRKHVPHAKLTELFYDPAGVYFDNGKKVKGAIGDHSDHIHFAI